jgi:hypothetical protein
MRPLVPAEELPIPPVRMPGGSRGRRLSCRFWGHRERGMSPRPAQQCVYCDRCGVILEVRALY